MGLNTLGQKRKKKPKHEKPKQTQSHVSLRQVTQNSKLWSQLDNVQNVSFTYSLHYDICKGECDRLNVQEIITWHMPELLGKYLDINKSNNSTCTAA